jgi:hypothetical protein
LFGLGGDAHLFGRGATEIRKVFNGLVQACLQCDRGVGMYLSLPTRNASV